LFDDIYSFKVRNIIKRDALMSLITEYTYDVNAERKMLESLLNTNYMIEAYELLLVLFEKRRKAADVRYVL